MHRSADDTVASVYSLSSSTPHLVGDQLSTFDRDLRALLRQAGDKVLDPHDGAKRYSELRRLMPRATRQALVSQLRELERAGAVRRTVSGHVPPRVEYSLTQLGLDCEPIVRQLHGWGRWYGDRAGRDVDWLVSLGGRWKVWVIHRLFDGTKRFSELQRLLAPISKQVLARELRELDELGLVYRLPAAPGTPRGAYALTRTGRESVPMFRQLYAWGRWTSAQTGVAFDWPID